MPDLAGRDPTDAERVDLTNASVTVVLAAADEDFDRCNEVIAYVGAEYGHDGVGLLCCALAEAIIKMADLGADGFVALHVRGGDGQVKNPDELPPALRPMTWAYRYVAAWANDDVAGTWALFRADLGDMERGRANVAGLVRLTSQVARQRRREGDAGLN